jgi:hypothetical protein
MTSRSKKSLHAAEQEREDVRTARANWKQEQPRLDPKKFVFIDETGTSTNNMTRLRGRCRRRSADSPLALRSYSASISRDSGTKFWVLLEESQLLD